MTTLHDEIKPLPCPFCDSLRLAKTSNGHESVFVECEDCGSSGPAEDHEDEAIISWNKRHAAAELAIASDARIEALEAKIERLEANAKRFRWAFIESPDWTYAVCKWIEDDQSGDWIPIKTQADIDALDAALLKGQP